MTVLQIARPQVTRPTESRNALTDMPAGLTKDERHAYVKGYAKGAVAYARKNGGGSVRPVEPSVPVWGRKDGRDIIGSWVPAKADPVELARAMREHETDRHPTAHRAGLSMLRAWIRKYSTPERVAVVEMSVKGKPAVTAAAPTKITRKSHTTTKETVMPTIKKSVALAAIAAVPTPRPAPAPVETVTPPAAPVRPTYATKKSVRRELAAAMRAAGLSPSDPVAWAASKAAGKPVAA